MTLTARIMLRLVASLAYLSRPWSCQLVLGAIPAEGSPYSGFDLHAVGILLASGTTLLLSPLAWYLVRSGTEGPISLKRLDLGSAGIALILLLLLGTPLFTQFAYLTGLPLSMSWPIAMSSAVWFVVAAYLSLAALTRDGRRA